MFIKRRMDKEDMVYITMEYHSAIKKNEIMLFAATWMQPEIVILSEASQRKKYHMTSLYMWNLKCDKNKPVDETETDSGTYRIDLLLVRWRGLGEEWSGRLVGG